MCISNADMGPWDYRENLDMQMQMMSQTIGDKPIEFVCTSKEDHTSLYIFVRRRISISSRGRKMWWWSPCGLKPV